MITLPLIPWLPFKQMRRKGVSVSEVYDARALRVVVGDASGSLQELAIETCYSLLSTIHK